MAVRDVVRDERPPEHKIIAAGQLQQESEYVKSNDRCSGDRDIARAARGVAQWEHSITLLPYRFYYTSSP